MWYNMNDVIVNFLPMFIVLCAAIYFTFYMTIWRRRKPTSKKEKKAGKVVFMVSLAGFVISFILALYSFTFGVIYDQWIVFFAAFIFFLGMFIGLSMHLGKALGGWFLPGILAPIDRDFYKSTTTPKERKILTIISLILLAIILLLLVPYYLR